MSRPTREQVQQLADFIERVTDDNELDPVAIYATLLRPAAVEVYFRRKERQYPSFRRESKGAYDPRYHSREVMV